MQTMKSKINAALEKAGSPVRVLKTKAVSFQDLARSQAVFAYCAGFDSTPETYDKAKGIIESFGVLISR